MPGLSGLAEPPRNRAADRRFLCANQVPLASCGAGTRHMRRIVIRKRTSPAPHGAGHALPPPGCHPVWEAPGPGAALTWHLLSTCSCATLAMMNCRVASAPLPAVSGFLRQDSACRLSSLSSSLMNAH